MSSRRTGWQLWKMDSSWHETSSRQVRRPGSIAICWISCAPVAIDLACSSLEGWCLSCRQQQMWWRSNSDDCRTDGISFVTWGGTTCRLLRNYVWFIVKDDKTFHAKVVKRQQTWRQKVPQLQHACSTDASKLKPNNLKKKKKIYTEDINNRDDQHSIDTRHKSSHACSLQ